MTLAELIDQATDLANAIGDDAAETCEVKFAANPAWAMQHDVRSLQLVTSLDEPVAFLVDAGQVPDAPYLPEAAANELFG